jgi:hypothetical protein
MHVRSALALFAITILPYGFIPAQTPVLPAQQPSVPAQVYYIEINAEQSCPVSGCAEHLAVGNFAISQDGRTYPVTLARPSKTTSDPAEQLPAHLLVLLPAGEKRPKDSALVQAIGPILEQGWMVSIARKDGSFTPYFADERQLQADLATAQAGLTDAHQAIEELNAFPGLRVLLVDVLKEKNKPAAERFASLVKSNVPVYYVDGGLPMRISYDDSWGYSGGRGGPARQGSDYITRKKPFEDGGVVHEVKLDQAVSQVLKDSRLVCDLRFEVPAAEAGSKSPIRLRLAYGMGIYSADADLYSVSPQTVDRRSIEVRIIPPQKLIKDDD